MKVTSDTQKIEKLCLWVYLLKNNQGQQFVKFFISIMSCTHVHNL